jgi:methanogenic corrinoid protein MtbC1
MMTDRHHEKRHPIQVVARRSGLTPHLLRAWERRYHVVAPERTDTGRRLYSDADVDRLRLLHQATEAGRRISQLAGLSEDELAVLVLEDQVQATAVSGEDVEPGDPLLLLDCMDAVEDLDAVRLEELLARELVSRSSRSFIEGLVAPLMVEVGRRWHEGELGVAHEHMATAVLRGLVARVLTGSQPRQVRGTLVAAAPAGQLHDVGAMFAAASAASEGWRVVFLGADLPAEEIARAAAKVEADAVALSVAYPDEEGGLEKEMRRLRAALPAGTLLLVGGRGSTAYRRLLDEIGGLWLADLTALRETLRALGRD